MDELDTGSFRDRTSRVFYNNGEVYRALSEVALNDYLTISNMPFFKNAMKDGDIIETKEVDKSTLKNIDLTSWAGVLHHKRIPLVTYPYEWSFSMLKDAALLQLKLLKDAIDNDFILKDSSAFNIQFEGTKPVFIDVGSYEKLEPGPWVGYLQFCQMFLFPLMLEAYKGVPFQSLMRGDIDGIGVDHMNCLMSFRDLFRKGVFTNIYLHSKLQNRKVSSVRNVRKELKDSGFGKELIKANIQGLIKLISSLKPLKQPSAWADYATDNSYLEEDNNVKRAFINEVSQLKHRKMVWDFGANTGAFSRIAATNSDLVIAADFDHVAVEKMYHQLQTENIHNILPIVMNLANPSPNQGWRGQERKDLGGRGKPDLILALALIHHIVIAANIPLKEFVDWLATFESELVLEFVTREDEMVKTLLANKVDNYTDYDQTFLEQCLKEHYTITKQENVKSGKRVLYYCTKK